MEAAGAAAERKMNITTKGKRKSSPAPTPKLDSKKKPTPKPRNPLKDLTSLRSNTYTSSYTISSTGSNSSCSSSSASIEPSKGCLRFFLPNPISKIPSKTPKSAPISKPRSNPLNSKKTQTTHKPKSSKGPTFRGLEQTPHLKSRDFKEFGSGVQKWQFSRNVDENGDSLTATPVVSKMGRGSGLDEKVDVEENENTTPPVQASNSPEIQYGSSFVATKSACYGAGHVLSGVTDKRKCRPRGILAVEEEKKLEFSRDDESFGGFFKSSRLSLVPAPIEASMRWLSPTCEMEDDQEESLQSGPTPFPSPSSPSFSYGHDFYSGSRGNTNSTSNTTGSNRRSPCVFTPTAHLNFKGLLISEAVTPNEEKGSQHQSPVTEISPSSRGDSLGSYNAVCTPTSDSSLSDSVGFSWFKNGKGSMFGFDSMSNVRSTPTLSPIKHKSSGDPADVLPLPGFSFQFTHPSRPSSNFFDESQVQKTPNDRRLGFSSGSYGNFSQSQMRISWRDGLISQMFENDDLDFCRLSDEEEDISCEDDKNLVQDPIVSDTVMSKKVVPKQPGADKLCNTNMLEKPSSCKESITTEGSELIASSDSDWDLCYRNQLFEA